MKINYTTGFAGTGKSTDLLKLLRKLNSDSSVCLAPTHKALHRLGKEYNGRVELKTIHSLLGLIPTVNEKAKHIGHINSIMKLDKDIRKDLNKIDKGQKIDLIEETLESTEKLLKEKIS